MNIYIQLESGARLVLILNWQTLSQVEHSPDINNNKFETSGEFNNKTTHIIGHYIFEIKKKKKLGNKL